MLGNPNPCTNVEIPNGYVHGMIISIWTLSRVEVGESGFNTIFKSADKVEDRNNLLTSSGQVLMSIKLTATSTRGRLVAPTDMLSLYVSFQIGQFFVAPLFLSSSVHVEWEFQW